MSIYQWLPIAVCIGALLYVYVKYRQTQLVRQAQVPPSTHTSAAATEDRDGADRIDAVQYYWRPG